MELYIIRHAVAEPLGKRNEFSDEKRMLTDEGRERMRVAARGLRKQGGELDLLLTSPLIRAAETAEIVAAALEVGKKQIRQTTNLPPGAAAGELLAEIRTLPGVESLALIGHEPDLSSLISRIIQTDVSALSIQLKKGSVCCINITETVPALRGELMWLLTPRQLRLLSKA